MSNAHILIVAEECAGPCANEPDIERRIRKAMRPVAKSHWMFPGDDHQETRMKGALAAVLMDPMTTDGDKDLIARSMKSLATLGAIFNGVPIDFGEALKELEGCLPLLKIWAEEKAAE